MTKMVLPAVIPSASEGSLQWNVEMLRVVQHDSSYHLHLGSLPAELQ